MYQYMVLDINVFGIAILCYLLYFFRVDSKFGTISDKTFIIIVISNIVILLTDLIFTSITRISGNLVRSISVVSKSIFFIACIFLCLSWLYYCIIRVRRLDKLESIMLKYIIPIPFVLFVLFMVLTIRQNTIFWYNDANKYYRRAFFHLTTIFGFGYIIASFVYMMVKMKSLNKGDFSTLILVPGLAIFLGLLQNFIHFPMLFLWPALAIVFNGVGINNPIIKSSFDHLTGLNNRAELDSYLHKSTLECYDKNCKLGIKKWI